MVKKIKGFTLIELVIFIIILAAIAAFCISHYLRLANETDSITTKSIAQALNSANTANSLLRKLNPARGIAISNCSDANNLLYKGIPSGMTINPLPVSTDVSVRCTLLGPSGSDTSAIFILDGID